MSWEDIFKILAAALASAGGAGALIWFISKSLSKAMFERYMEKVKHEYDEELENIRHELDSLTYISNVQYEKEFQIYLEVWEKMDECTRYTNMLYPKSGYIPSKNNKDEYLKFCEDKNENYAHKYNDFLKCMKKYEPFYEENIFNDFNEVLEICSKVGAIFVDEEIMRYKSPTFTFSQNEPMLKEDKKFVYSESKEQIMEIRKRLKNNIKDYLNSLKIINN